MSVEHERRVATSIPKACFGVEYDPGDPACTRSCPYAATCATATGARAQHSPVTQARYELEALSKLAASAEPEATSLYQLAYEQVLARRAPDALSPSAAVTVAQSAQQLGVSTEVYIYSCLLGHQVSSQRTFRASMLQGETAIKRVKFYRQQAVSRFNAADLASLGTLTGRDTLAAQRSTFLANETLFGGWILGARSRRGGNGVSALFTNRECAFSPSWLAIESSYQKWRDQAVDRAYLQTDDDGAPVFDEIGRHRYLVSKVVPATRGALLRLRSDILPTAASHVLQKHGINPSHVLVKSPVKNAFSFWLQLGDALMQLHLLKIINR